MNLKLTTIYPAGTWRQNNVISTSMLTSHRRRYDVILTSCACWEYMLVVPGFLFGISLQQIGETHSYTGRIVRNPIAFGPIKTQHNSLIYSVTALATCETSQVLLAGVPGGFSRDSPVFAHLLIGPSHMS